MPSGKDSSSSSSSSSSSTITTTSGRRRATSGTRSRVASGAGRPSDSRPGFLGFGSRSRATSAVGRPSSSSPRDSRSSTTFLSASSSGSQDKVSFLWSGLEQNNMNPVLYSIILAVTKKEQSSENIQFYKDVLQFQKKFNDRGYDKKGKAIEIYEKYIESGKVNISGVAGSELKDNIESLKKGGGVGDDIFNIAHQQIGSLIKRNILPRNIDTIYKVYKTVSFSNLKEDITKGVKTNDFLRKLQSITAEFDERSIEVDQVNLGDLLVAAASVGKFKIVKALIEDYKANPAYLDDKGRDIRTIIEQEHSDKSKGGLFSGSKHQEYQQAIQAIEEFKENEFKNAHALDDQETQFEHVTTIISCINGLIDDGNPDAAKEIITKSIEGALDSGLDPDSIVEQVIPNLKGGGVNIGGEDVTLPNLFRVILDEVMAEREVVVVEKSDAEASPPLSPPASSTGKPYSTPLADNQKGPKGGGRGGSS